MNKQYESGHAKDLKSLSDQDFLTLGQDKIAYTRAIEVDGETAFALHSADGSALDIAETQEAIAALAVRHEMFISTVH